MRLPRLGLIPQGRLSAARGRMICASAYTAPQGARYAPLHMQPCKSTPCARPRLGLLRRGSYQLPAGAWYAPLHMQLCKEHAMRPPRFGFDSVGAAISRPRAHGMRPYIWGPARSTPWARLVWV